MPLITVKQDFLTPNKYSRPGLKNKRKPIIGIEIHYVQNPGTSAKENRDYFESRKGGKRSFGSTHYIIDIDGDIIQMIPEDEVAYSSGGILYKPGIKDHFEGIPHLRTISTEFCHPHVDGKPTRETYKSLLHWTAAMCQKYALGPQNVYRHWDLNNDKKWGPTGKECPKFFVENPGAWSSFKKDLDNLLKTNDSFELRYI